MPLATINPFYSSLTITIITNCRCRPSTRRGTSSARRARPTPRSRPPSARRCSRPRRSAATRPPAARALPAPRAERARTRAGCAALPRASSRAARRAAAARPAAARARAARTGREPAARPRLALPVRPRAARYSPLAGSGALFIFYLPTMHLSGIATPRRAAARRRPAPREAAPRRPAGRATYHPLRIRAAALAAVLFRPRLTCIRSPIFRLARSPARRRPARPARRAAQVSCTRARGGANPRRRPICSPPQFRQVCSPLLLYYPRRGSPRGRWPAPRPARARAGAARASRPRARSPVLPPPWHPGAPMPRCTDRPLLAASCASVTHAPLSAPRRIPWHIPATIGRRIKRKQLHSTARCRAEGLPGGHHHCASAATQETAGRWLAATTALNHHDAACSATESRPRLRQRAITHQSGYLQGPVMFRMGPIRKRLAHGQGLRCACATCALRSSGASDLKA